MMRAMMLAFPSYQARKWGQTFSIGVRTQYSVIPERLMVNSFAAGCFIIEDIIMNSHGQLNREVPADIFHPVALPVIITPPEKIVEAGASILLRVRAYDKSPFERPKLVRHNWKSWWSRMVLWKRYRRKPPLFQAVMRVAVKELQR